MCYRFWYLQVAFVTITLGGQVMHLYKYIEHQRYLRFFINNKAVLDLLGDAGLQEA